MTAEVKQYGGWTPITDTLQLTAIDNNIVQATKILASQAGRTIDSVVRDILVGGTNVIYAPKVADGVKAEVKSRANLDKTAKLTSELIMKAATQLKAMNADPIDGSYIAIIHPYISYDLRSDPAWIDVHKYAQPDEIYNGEIGKLHGVRFVETSEAKIWKDATCPAGLAVFATPDPRRTRLRHHRDRGRRPRTHRKAAGLRRRPAEPACIRGLEGHPDGRASGGAVHDPH